jgi:dolichol-phosphate mannosyltransferase
MDQTYSRIGEDNRKRRASFVRELVVFALVGGSGFVVDAGTFWVFSAVVGMYYLYANVFGVVLGIVWTFIGHKYVTFRDRSGGDRAVLQGVQFLIVALFGLAVQSVVLYIVDVLSVERFFGEFDQLFGKVCAVGVAAVSNYVLNKFWTFRKR